MEDELKRKGAGGGKASFMADELIQMGNAVRGKGLEQVSGRRVDNTR